ncbi:Phosphoglycolate phosphatase (EC [Olavius algarvensis associated proteobacterium Delta 3]|nr:Phosphoglycolate phosphatase (EC [Olavius algarvensis associated proteobacterium Delta 3]CAB5098049.1 Phosphoglycolate phosphatase (EC [Olavius algarvensis associated proteobacterium Delta 3]
MPLRETDCRAAVFDLDGTLLDTLADIGDTCNRVLEKRGFPVHSLESYRYFVGEGARVLVKRALPDGAGTPGMIQQCLAEYLSEYLAIEHPRALPYDGIPDLLDNLSARGFRLAVLSNKSHPATVRCVTELLGGWTFDAVLGLRENVPRKPDPAGALEIAGKLAVAVNQCLFIGDTATDMHTATASGMIPVGVLWGFRPAEELRQAGARFLIERPVELLELL